MYNLEILLSNSVNFVVAVVAVDFVVAAAVESAFVEIADFVGTVGFVEIVYFVVYIFDDFCLFVEDSV